MDPVTGLAALAGITLASVAGLALKKRQEEGFDALPEQETQYQQSVDESQSRYNMFSGLVNPITNAIIPVGSSSAVQAQQKDAVKAMLGSYSAQFDPNSKQTVVLKKFENQFKPRADGSKSLFAAARFCRSAGSQGQPFTTYNADGSIRSPGAVDPTGGWKFDEVCGVCFTDGVDEEGNRFREQRGMLVEPGMKEDAYQEQQDNGWSYARVGPSVGSCNGAPNGPVFATNAKDMERYRSRQACKTNKSIGGTDKCGMCYDTDDFSAVPDDTEVNDVEIWVYGVGNASYLHRDGQRQAYVLREDGGSAFTLSGVKEGDSFSIEITPIAGRETATSVWGFLESKTPRDGKFSMPLNLILTIDDESGTVPSKSGGFFRDEDRGLDLAKIRPAAGKTKMRLRGLMPFTFVQAATFPGMDCLDGPYQTKPASLTAFATDQPCFVRGARPGAYNDACLRARVLDAGCTNAGDLFKNPQTLNLKNGAAQNLQQIYTTLQEIAANDMVDPAMTLQCSGRKIETPCDPFILRQGTLKFGDALNGSATQRTQAEQCLSYLYKNLGANEVASPPRVGPTYSVWNWFYNANKDQKNLACLPDGALNPETTVAGKQTLVRVADQGYSGKIGVDAIKQYLTDQLNLAADTNRNANTDPERKAAIQNCFGKNLNALAVAQTGAPTIVQNACGIVAQYVRVLPSQTIGESQAFIEISQIAVIDKTGANVAVGKSTTGTSPSYPTSSAGSYNASFAIDGQLYAKARNFYHSLHPGGSSQFLLNLGAPTDITSVILWSRADQGGSTWIRKSGLRLQLLDSRMNVVDQKVLNANIQEEVRYLQQGADSTCKAGLAPPAALQLPAGMTLGLYTRFYDITDPNPDLVPGNRGWGGRLGTPGAYSTIRFNDNNIGRFDRCGVVVKGYYIAPGPETLYLRTESDDGIYIEFNGRQVLRNWTIHGPTADASSPIQISAAGVYPFELRFYEWGGGALCNFYYRMNDEANWRTDLSARFAYKPAEIQEEDAAEQARIRAAQQAAAAAAALQNQGRTGLTISFPDGRQIRNDNGTLRLNRGTPITFDLVQRGDLYKSSTNVALQITGTQSFLRHAGLVGYAHPFAANNGDFAWQIIPQGSGYLLKNEFGYAGGRWFGFGNPAVGSYLGYDAGSDTLRLMSYTTPTVWTAWKFSPLPASSLQAGTTQQRAIIYGPWIGPRGNAEVQVQQTARLNDGTEVFMIFESPYTKMVTRAGDAKYYTGSPSQFNANAWNSYASAGRNYLLKFV
jgi:hypothetical protein